MKSKKELLKTILFPVFAVLFVFLVWAIAAYGKNNPLILPQPTEVLKKFFLLFREPSFWVSVGKSLARTLLCFGISFLCAFVLAFCKPLHRFLLPIVSVLRSAPTVAVILILYAFTTSEILAVAVGFLIAFPVLYSGIRTAVEAVDKDLTEMAKVYKVPLYKQFVGIYLPQTANAIFDCCRSTVSLTLKVIVAAEILTVLSDSIGGKIQTAYASFEISFLLAWTLVAVVLGYLLEILVVLIKKLVIRWDKKWN